MGLFDQGNQSYGYNQPQGMQPPTTNPYIPNKATNPYAYNLYMAQPSNTNFTFQPNFSTGNMTGDADNVTSQNNVSNATASNNPPLDASYEWGMVGSGYTGPDR
jgi:hypothetical protein